MNNEKSGQPATQQPQDEGRASQEQDLWAQARESYEAKVRASEELGMNTYKHWDELTEDERQRWVEANLA